VYALTELQTTGLPLGWLVDKLRAEQKKPAA
jgi:hypothetical protein